MMITCKVCNKEFRAITNSHLRDKHSLTLEQYLEKYPDAILTSLETREQIGKTNSKSYEERYGLENALKLKQTRKIKAIKQFEDLAQKEIRKKHNWKGYKEIAGTNWTYYKKGALKRGFEFDITIEYAWDLFLEQDRKCALSGQDIGFNIKTGSLSKYGYQKNTASLDRIDSKKGYVRGNVQWLHKDLNKLKSNLDEKEFIELCTLVSNMNKKA
jgi:hypothetical protein